MRLSLLLTLVMVSTNAIAQQQEKAISGMLHRMFDKPDAMLTVAPIVVSGDHAIADWAQGEMGGRALLRRRHSQWSIVLCTGDEIKTQDAMIKAGVPTEDASSLARDLANAEAALDPKQRAQFSRFEGLLMMDGESKHPH
jgi:hypothetical protein